MVLPTAERVKRDNQLKNLLIYGEPFTGKTTLAAQMNEKTLIISTDNNYLHLDTPAINVKDFSEVMSVLDELEKNPDSFDCVIVDLIEDILEMTRQAILNKLGIEYEGEVEYGGAWHQSNRALTGILARFSKLPQKVIFIAHAEKVSTKSKIGIERIEIRPKVRAKVIEKLTGYCQMVIRTFRDDEGKYLIETDGEGLVNARFEHSLNDECTPEEFIDYFKNA